MSLLITRILIVSLALTSVSQIFGEEISEWREIVFYVPAVDFSFEIRTCQISIEEEKSGNWNGSIQPECNIITGMGKDDKWFIVQCSIDTLKYAYWLTNKTRASIVNHSDWDKDPNPLSMRIKFLFTVRNNIGEINKKSYEGEITEKEFLKLVEMLKSDSNASRMLQSDSNSKESIDFSKYLIRKENQIKRFRY